MRDGAKIYVEVFRPEAEREFPALLAWAPYGKHRRVKYKYFPPCGVCDSDLPELATFEAADPKYWCAQDYAVVYADS